MPSKNTTSDTLQPGHYYHLYNRGNNRENIFIEERNYAYFLSLYAKYIEPIADTYAYCLLRNHFHFLVRIKDPLDIQESTQDCQSFKDWQSSTPSRAFSNLFSTYTKAINKAYQRSGSLFEKPFHRKLIQNEAHFTALVTYIHHNPQTHGFVDDFRDWPFSSYDAILSIKPTRVYRSGTLEWFGDREIFEEFHLNDLDVEVINDFIAVDI